ncbi:hypothetical protein [Psychromonas antarctica]|uniref:hypothetical protein n=1 Tax=Psychromonas antarctica TaxID=67573 RepID=UPI001EE7DE84|nr:hypothetical protein [Psychromonas antarctica]MCG6200997.1 hypothetical protein [Psychromonas antarctica]
MKNIILCIIGVFLSLSVFAQNKEMIAFENFNRSLIKYGDKVELCRSLAKENAISEKDVALLKEFSIDTLKNAFPYLAELASNECTQPERGRVAENILNLQSLNLDEKDPVYSHILMAMSETQRMEFNIAEFNTSVVFFQLSKNEQERLMSIESIKKTFNMVSVLELIHPESFN